MGYKLSQLSRDRLKGVKPQLIEVVERAIQISEVDFRVTEGVRTLTRQKELLKAGSTTTLNSRHLTGDAVDLAPMVGREVRYDWALVYKVAEAMRTAALELGVKVRWGGVWDKNLADLKGGLSDDVADYAARRKAAGKRVFLDGPHFELPV